MTMWAESFRKIYPNVNIQIEGKGSSTAPPALIEGTSQLGPMSRSMKSKEIEAFEAKFGRITSYNVCYTKLLRELRLAPSISARQWRHSG